MLDHGKLKPGARANAGGGIEHNRKRDAEIRGLAAAGFGLRRLAKRFKLSEGRVWQIANSYRGRKPQPRDDENA